MKKIISLTLAVIILLGVMVVGVPAMTASAATGKVTLQSVAYNSNATVTIGWNSSFQPTGYQIARKKLGDTGYTYTEVNSFNSSYNDKNVVSGTVYFYQVRAFMMSMYGRTYGAWSNTKAVTTLYRPTVTSLNDVGNMLNINWNKIKGVSHYKLAFKRLTDKEWNYRTVKSNYYNVLNPTKGATYAVQICPMNGSIAGQWSAVKTVVIGVSQCKPVITSIIPDSGNYGYAGMEWSYPLSCDGYYLFHKNSTDAGWSYEVIRGDLGTFNYAYLVGLKSGDTYYFQIRAFFKNGGLSPYSKVFTYTVPTYNYDEYE